MYEGVNALFPWHGYAEPAEVCLRIAGVFPTLEEAEQVPYEFDVLASCTGAAATACGRAREIGWAEEVVGLYTTFVPHEYVRPSVVEVVGGALAGSA